MGTTVDAAGRLVIPKALRDAIGLAGGGAVEVTVDGSGLLITADRCGPAVTGSP